MLAKSRRGQEAGACVRGRRGARAWQGSTPGFPQSDGSSPAASCRGHTRDPMPRMVHSSRPVCAAGGGDATQRKLSLIRRRRARAGVINCGRQHIAGRARPPAPAAPGFRVSLVDPANPHRKREGRHVVDHFHPVEVLRPGAPGGDEVVPGSGWVGAAGVGVCAGPYGCALQRGAWA